MRGEGDDIIEEEKEEKEAREQAGTEPEKDRQKWGAAREAFLLSFLPSSRASLLPY